MIVGLGTKGNDAIGQFRSQAYKNPNRIANSLQVKQLGNHIRHGSAVTNRRQVAGKSVPGIGDLGKLLAVKGFMPFGNGPATRIFIETDCGMIVG